MTEKEDEEREGAIGLLELLRHPDGLEIAKDLLRLYDSLSDKTKAIINKGGLR